MSLVHVDDGACIRGIQGARGRWITSTEAKTHVVGGKPFWECTGPDSKVVPLVQHDLSGPHERPIWMYESSGDMYLGGWQMHWERRVVEHGFGVKYYGGSTTRRGMVNVGYWQFGELQGLGPETEEAVANWWNEHELRVANDDGNPVSTSPLFEASGVSRPAKGSTAMRGKRPASKFKSPSIKRGRPRASGAKNRSRAKKSASVNTNSISPTRRSARRMAQKAEPEAKKEATDQIFEYRLKPKGWEVFKRGKRDGWSFIPGSLLPPKNSQEFVDAKNHVFQHGIEAVHFANCYDGLKEMIEQYGEDYSPTMPEPSALDRVSTCRAAIPQANEDSAKEQEGIEDESHSCPNHVQTSQASSVAKASPGSDKGVTDGARGSHEAGVALMSDVANISLIMNTMQQCEDKIASLETGDTHARGQEEMRKYKDGFRRIWETLYAKLQTLISE